MKIYLLIAAYFFSTSNVFAQVQKKADARVVQQVEAACGKCMFGIKNDECKLAVRINGKAYHVKGANIDDFGDAHRADGFCNMIRIAAVQGRQKNNSFKVSSFKLLPLQQ